MVGTCLETGLAQISLGPQTLELKKNTGLSSMQQTDFGFIPWLSRQIDSDGRMGKPFSHRPAWGICVMGC